MRPASRFRSMSRGTIIRRQSVYGRRLSLSRLSEESMRGSVLTTVMLLAASGIVRAQSAEEQIRAADRAYDAKDLTGALDLYGRAIAAEPKNYEALWKAARTSVDLGVPASTAAQRNALFSGAEQYARRAVAANPTDVEGHFVLAWVLGRTALSQSPRGRVKYGNEVRAHALE